jgi:hypothetical protein
MKNHVLDKEMIRYVLICKAEACTPDTILQNNLKVNENYQQQETKLHVNSTYCREWFIKLYAHESINQTSAKNFMIFLQH